MTLIMGVSGIRGIVGQTMTPELVRRAGGAFARHLQLHAGAQRPRVVIARDSRPSGDSYLTHLSDVLSASSCDPINIGIVSTPCAARFVRSQLADGGIILTASHNPTEYNGIKFITADGAAPDDATARRILALLDDPRMHDTHAVASSASNSSTAAVDAPAHASAVGDHVQAVLDTIDRNAVALRRYRVVLDSVCGAGGEEGAALLNALGCEVIHLNALPTGIFPHAPEPLAENLASLSEAVAEQGAHVGFAQDPDADRLAMVDERARYIGEEYTLVLGAMLILAQRPGSAVANLSTSRMLDDVAGRIGGCRVVRSAVGEANVVSMMRRVGAVVGGEGNGGVIDPRVGWVRDSLVAMAQTLALMAMRGATVSEIVADIPRYHMVKTKFPAPAGGLAPLLSRVRDHFHGERLSDVDGVRVDRADAWVHIRGSNTEPIIRIIAEASSPASATALVEEVRELAVL